MSTNLVRRAYRIVISPRSEWEAVRSENRPWRSVLLGYVLPLSFLPAVGWAIGLAVSGGLPADAGLLGSTFAGSVVLTVMLSLLCVILLALVFYLLAPMHDAERHWDRAVSVAGYGSTPVLLAGVLLVVPIMVMASVVALLHNFLLYYVGLHAVIGCRQSAAAEYLALSCMLAAIASGILGAAGGALGLL
jgi:hypothetical protein